MIVYNGDCFYRFKELYDRRPLLKNRVAPEIEDAVEGIMVVGVDVLTGTLGDQRRRADRSQVVDDDGLEVPRGHWVC